MLQLDEGDLADRPQNVAPRPRRVRLLVAAAILLVVAILVGGYAMRTVARDPLAGLKLATVTRADLEEVVTAAGRIQPRDHVDVGAQVSGQLLRLLVEPGDRVRAGELLAEIDPQIQAAEVESIRAELARLRAELDNAEAAQEFAGLELERQSRLAHVNAASRRSFELARRDVRTTAAGIAALKAQIVQAESSLKANEAQLGYTRIYAPIDGTVVSVEARQGQTINAAYSTPVLLRIADLSSMTVWTEVSEADVTRLHEGMPLYFRTLGHQDRRWDGTLRQILPAPVTKAASTDTKGTSIASAGVVLYTALFDVDNASGDLRPEMTAQVFFLTRVARDALTLPVDALKEPGDDAAEVDVVTAGGIQRRRVRLGMRTKLRAEIVSGLNAGDRVVVGRLDGQAPSLVRFEL